MTIHNDGCATGYRYATGGTRNRDRCRAIVMSIATRPALLITLGSQQTALELAIERGSVALQCNIWRRMAILESMIVALPRARGVKS
jgi:hypothetical protein